MTIPNLLTIFRLIVTPIFLYYFLQDTPKARLIAFVLFVLAALSDLLDGYLARKLSQDSKLGRFLDPLADKFLVITALMAFYYLDNQISIWMILAIISRDILVTIMRYLAIRKGVELKTTGLAKTKTAFQMTAIILILMIFIIRSYRFDIQNTFDQGHKKGHTNMEISIDLVKQFLTMLPNKEIGRKQKTLVFAETIPYFLILITTIVTVISGARYLIANHRVLYPPYHLFQKPGAKS